MVFKDCASFGYSWIGMPLTVENSIPSPTEIKILGPTPILKQFSEDFEIIKTRRQTNNNMLILNLIMNGDGNLWKDLTTANRRSVFVYAPPSK